MNNGYSHLVWAQINQQLNRDAERRRLVRGGEPRTVRRRLNRP